MKRYALRLILLTIELGHKRPQKVRWAYPDIALFLLGKALSACLIFWVAARGKTPLGRYILEGNSRDPEFGQNTLRDLPSGHGCGIAEDNDFRDSNERCSGCGIPVKKERECWIIRSISRAWLYAENVIGQRAGTCY